VVARAQPRNPVGWLLLAAALGLALSSAAGEYEVLIYRQGHAALPFGPAAVLLNLLWSPGIVTFGLIVLLFPDGRLTRGWRRFMWAYLAVGALAHPGVSRSVLGRRHGRQMSSTAVDVGPLTTPPARATLRAMVWRIHFTAGDLQRIQVSPTLGPLAETVMAMSLLRCPMQPSGLYNKWRGQVKAKVTPQMAALANLIPVGSKGVDLCTLTGPAPTIEQGLKALMEMPRDHYLVEAEYVAMNHKLPETAWAVADADGSARYELAQAARAAHRVLVAPYWRRIEACLHAEQVARSRVLALGGPDRLLASIQSELIRWQPPVLEVHMCGDLDIDLEGRGLTLVPSVFVGGFPTLHQNPNDETAAPVLVLPTADERVRHGHLWDSPKDRTVALAALVGRNRAAVLSAIADGGTTTEVASRVGISLAAASQHASVLRSAGLIITRRQGSSVLHVLTPLGAELLQAG